MKVKSADDPLITLGADEDQRRMSVHGTQPDESFAVRQASVNTPALFSHVQSDTPARLVDSQMPVQSGPTARKSWQGYGVALVATAVTLWFRLAIDVPLGGRLTLVIFTLPIMISAYVGGLRPGLLATALCYFATSYYLLPPTHSFAFASKADFLQEIFLIVAGVVISVSNEALHRARRKAEIATEEHQQAEMRALRSEKRSRDLIDGLGPSMFVALLTPTGILVEVNQAPLTAAGLNSEDVLGKPFAETHWWSHSPAIQQQLREAIERAAHGEASRYDVHTQGAGGQVIDIDFCLQPLRDETGEIVFLVPSASVITERKRAEEALTASEARYRTLFACAPDGIVIADPESTYLDANESICRMLGYTRDELIGLHASDIVIPEEVEHIGPALSAIKATSDYHREWQFRRKDGSVFPAEVIATTMPDGNLLGMIRDITERKRVETTLTRLASIIEFSDDAIISKDLNFTVTSWNRGAEKIFGYTAGEMVGTSIMRLIPADRQDEDIQIMEKVKCGESVEHFDTVRQTKDGRLIDISVTASPIKDASGKVTSISKIARDITERRRAESALRETQARLNSTLAAGSIGTWTWDLANDRLVADEFTARMFSIEPDEAANGLASAAYLEAVMEEDQPSVADALARAIKSCGQYDIEYRVRQKDGELCWLQAKGRVEGDAAGQAVYFHGAVLNITERKRAEGRFRRLIDSNAQGVMFWNTKGEITEANDAFLKIVSYTREDLEAGHIGWAGMTPPEYADLDRRSLEELKIGGICTPYEKEFICKDGTRVPIIIGAAIFEDSPQEGVCFVLDITERKRTEHALRESEEYFRFLNNLSEATRTLADPAQIMAVMARMLCEHLHASRCAYADVGQDGEQFTILHDYTDGCASTVDTYHLSLFGARAVDTLRGGQTLIIRNVAAELLPDDGAEMFNAIGIQAIITCPLVKDGSLRALMAVHQTTPRNWHPSEITIVQDVVERCWATIERRAAEEKIHQLNAGLEQRVVERTAQLEAANKELEAFSYSVSHDLRAPLRAVDGFSQAVLEDYGPQLPEEGQRYLHTIRQSAQKMGTLIDDLLTFSRLSRAPLNKLEVNTGTLVRSILEDLDPQRERKIDLRIGDLPACQGDAALVKQVWINLLSNAFKYTGKRESPVVEIGSEQTSEGNVFFVRDNGTGFDMRYADKLFGVFQRLHRAEDYEGTGVGLAIVQRIVHRHGGRIWAEAAADRGATFYFTLENNTKL